MLRRFTLLMLTALAGCECSSKVNAPMRAGGPECALAPLIQPCAAYLKRTCSVDGRFVMPVMEQGHRGVVDATTLCDGGTTLLPPTGDSRAPQYVLRAGIGGGDGGTVALVLSVVGNPAQFPGATVTVPCGSCPLELPADWRSPRE